MISLKKSTSLILLTISAIFAFNCSNAFANVIDDSAITVEVKAKLATEKDMPNLEVITKEGVVKLKGQIDTSLQAGRAIEIASSAEGVKDVVDSELKVKESKSLLADAIITAKVKGKIRRLYIAKQIADEYELHVETTNQIVHIQGNVSRESDVDVIVAAAKEVKNVKSVKTNISK